MSEKALFTVGVFAGITEGRLLLKQRTEEGSIIPGRSFRGNWELPGGGVLDQEKISYALLPRELEREIEEELGVAVSIGPMPIFYPLPFKGPKGYDLALVTPIVVSSTISMALSFMADVLWVSTEELNQLARDFVAPDKKTSTDGKGLLSGWGKRMHCMALKALEHSTIAGFANQARRHARRNFGNLELSISVRYGLTHNISPLQGRKGLFYYKFLS